MDSQDGLEGGVIIVLYCSEDKQLEHRKMPIGLGHTEITGDNVGKGRSELWVRGV
jgi:hypothetical protein